jgi:hypothetical protein
MDAVRHSFAIQTLGKRPGLFQAQRYLYYCVRCKWTFLINDTGRNAVTPVDSAGKELVAHEAHRRLLTFAQGPCSATSFIGDRSPIPVEAQPEASSGIRMTRPPRDARGTSRPRLHLVSLRSRLEPGTR